MKTPVSDHHTARLTAGMASLGAGAIHVAVVPDHLATWWASGLFFILLASFQLLWAPAVAVTASRVVLVAGGVVGAGSIALWTGTRIWGQPVGPQAGTPLPVGPSGVIAGILELALVGCVVWALRARAPRHLRAPAAISSLGAGFAAVLALTVPGVSAALEHDHAAHTDQGGHDHGSGDAEGSHHEGPSTSETGQRNGSGPAHNDTRRRHGDNHGDPHGERSPSAPTRPDPSTSPPGDGHGHGDHSH